MTKEEFQGLLGRPEGETLDFKGQNYDLSDQEKKGDLIKDILSMANTPREGFAHIVLGVCKYPNGTYELQELDRHLDDANMQAQFSHRVRPLPRFSYEEFPFEGKTVAVVTILHDRSGPFYVVDDLGKKLQKGALYFRRSSRNDIATPEDSYRIISWFKGSNPSATPVAPAWEEFLQAVYGFEAAQRRYVLLAGPCRGLTAEMLSALGTLPWTAVFDFDPESETEGLLRAAGPALKANRRVLHLAVEGDRPTLHPDRSTLWFFARGLAVPRGRRS